MDEVEQGLSLQGATANEDKLQVGVPDTIATLARAGVRTWMLTGDKEETAVNIGYATRLLRPGMRVIHASTLNRTAMQGSRAVVALARESSRAASRPSGVSADRQRASDAEGDDDPRRQMLRMHGRGDLDEELGVPSRFVPGSPHMRSSSASPAPMQDSKLAAANEKQPGVLRSDVELVEKDRNRGKGASGHDGAPASKPDSHLAAAGPAPEGEGKAESASISTNGSDGQDGRPASQFEFRARAGSGGSTPRGRQRKSTLASIFGQDGNESDEDGFDAASHHSDDMQTNNRGDLGVLLGDGLLETVGLARQAAAPVRRTRPRSQSQAPGAGPETGVPRSGSPRSSPSLHGAKSSDSSAFASTPGRIPQTAIGAGAISKSKSEATRRASYSRRPTFSGDSLAGSTLATTAEHDGKAASSSSGPKDRSQSSPMQTVALPEPTSMAARNDDGGIDQLDAPTPMMRDAPQSRTPSPPGVPFPAASLAGTDGGPRGPVAIVVDEAVIDVMLGSWEEGKHDASPNSGEQEEVLLDPEDETMLSDPSERGQRWRARALAAALRRADAVICCRCRPDQKASLVKLIRDKVRRSRTLAIGDGANDVAMIREAHIGIGIAGREGMQAANAGDYAIGRFRLLKRLLLWHGRRNYIGMSKLVLFILWKNFIFVMAQFFYGLGETLAMRLVQ